MPFKLGLTGLCCASVSLTESARKVVTEPKGFCYTDFMSVSTKQLSSTCDLTRRAGYRGLLFFASKLQLIREKGATKHHRYEKTSRNPRFICSGWTQRMLAFDSAFRCTDGATRWRFSSTASGNIEQDDLNRSLTVTLQRFTNSTRTALMHMNLKNIYILT